MVFLWQGHAWSTLFLAGAAAWLIWSFVSARRTARLSHLWG